MPDLPFSKPRWCPCAWNTCLCRIGAGPTKQQLDSLMRSIKQPQPVKVHLVAYDVHLKITVNTNDLTLMPEQWDWAGLLGLDRRVDSCEVRSVTLVGPPPLPPPTGPLDGLPDAPSGPPDRPGEVAPPR